jgi:predicted sulfurtransferase
LLLVGCQSQPSDVDYTNGMALESAIFAQLIQDDSYILIDIRNEWEMEE